MFEKYLESSRLNVNVRQVFPPDFDYDLHGLSKLKPIATARPVD